MKRFQSVEDHLAQVFKIGIFPSPFLTFIFWLIDIDLSVWSPTYNLIYGGWRPNPNTSNLQHTELLVIKHMLFSHIVKDFANLTEIIAAHLPTYSVTWSSELSGVAGIQKHCYFWHKWLTKSVINPGVLWSDCNLSGGNTSTR